MKRILFYTILICTQLSCSNQQDAVKLTKEKAKTMVEERLTFISHKPIVYFSSIEETTFDTIFTDHINGYTIKGFYKLISKQGDTIKKEYSERVFVQDHKIMIK